MRRTTVFLPDETAEALHDAARRLGKPQSELLREALEEYLPRHARPWPTSVGAGRHTIAGVSAGNAKAWVRDQWARDRDDREGREEPDGR
jgi:predicted transcriptional regulator